MSASKSRRVVRRFASATVAGVVAFAMFVSGASTAQALTTVDGTLPLDLVEGSSLFGVEQYHDKIYEFTTGPLNTTVASDSTFAVQHNPAGTFDPASGKVFFITGALSACALNTFDPVALSHTFVISLANGQGPLSNCWGLTTMAGKTTLIASGSTIYDLDLETGATSNPRTIDCPGSGLAYDPSTGDLYSGTNAGALYRLTLTNTHVTCTLLTTLTDAIDGTSENLKGFTFDTDGTLYFLARWAPKLFSVKPADLATPASFFGDFRFTPSDEPLPIDGLVMVYTPLPDPSAQSGVSSASLPTTGVDVGLVAGVGTVGLLAGGLLLAVVVGVRRRASR